MLRPAHSEQFVPQQWLKGKLSPDKDRGQSVHSLTYQVVVILKFLSRLVFEFNAPIVRKDKSGSI